MLITVPLAGELKFYPLNETFRITFGAPTFFFFLLLLKRKTVLSGGLLTALSVVLFRIMLDYITLDHFQFAASAYTHYPTFFFYFTYALLFFIFKVSRMNYSAIVIGLIGLIIEIAADIVELTAQYIVLHTTIHVDSLSDMAVIAFAHSFIVLSFFNMMTIYESQSRERQIRKQNEHMLMLITSLYEETVHLKKTLHNTEVITKASYDLYRVLNQQEKDHSVLNQSLSKKALRIAGDIHEVKKDNQRIFAGLSKTISNESFQNYMKAEELIELIVRINKKYADSLHKQISFFSSVTGEHFSYHVYTILSIINNLVANAVEAIKDEGMIVLSVHRQAEHVEFHVQDDGPGVPLKYEKAIFEPGFTSKYDQFGNPSTGIGLSYVRDIVQELGGTIEAKYGDNGMIFIIQIPLCSLIQKG
ncbi:ATP-binding protein [Priestia aryabhattai]|uniref:ATP-binding protein n=1 Tax=Priestia aryabhattai TaxID=412384 RepID=UPI003D2A5460